MTPNQPVKNENLAGMSVNERPSRIVSCYRGNPTTRGRLASVQQHMAQVHLEAHRIVKHIVFAAALILLIINSCSLRAQRRVEAGVLLDYLSVSQTQTDNFGIGGRLGYRVHHDVMLEAELAYDYGVNFEEAYTNIANGNVTAIERTSIGVTQGLLGPKLQPARGHLRPFVTLKGGFVDFRLSPSLIPYSSVASAVFGIRDSNWNGALYPGAGAEATLGPLGLRLEFGDLVYFNGGAHNNPRITFGPIVRF